MEQEGAVVRVRKSGYFAVMLEDLRLHGSVQQARTLLILVLATARRLES